MEGFRDAFDHPHKLVVRGGQDHALCHKVANSHRGVVETERKRRRGAQSPDRPSRTPEQAIVRLCLSPALRLLAAPPLREVGPLFPLWFHR